ncbi:MAG: hypothetical protein EU535_03865 [Promethearchaeota archaeon]|nr:MAG: hypothetical protein EU535_03865 [Candidatus Lokiarchaeota archaeon]
MNGNQLEALLVGEEITSKYKPDQAREGAIVSTLYCATCCILYKTSSYVEFILKDIEDWVTILLSNRY